VSRGEIEQRRPRLSVVSLLHHFGIEAAGTLKEVDRVRILEEFLPELVCVALVEGVYVEPADGVEAPGTKDLDATALVSSKSVGTDNLSSCGSCALFQEQRSQLEDTCIKFSTYYLTIKQPKPN
jgi:hypothetical protein